MCNHGFGNYDWIAHSFAGGILIFSKSALYNVNMIVSFIVCMTEIYTKNGYKIVFIIDELHYKSTN